MKNSESLQNLLNAYKNYYTVKTEDCHFPFVAEAEFHSHTEKYLLVKSARLADFDSNEYVFFISEQNLSLDKLLEYDEIAWKLGLSRVNPNPAHRNSDVTLIVIADKIEDSVFKNAKKIK